MERKKIAVVIALLLVTLLWSDEEHYRIYSPLVGEIGELRMKKMERGSSYRIEAKATSRGIVKMLTGGRWERYLSEGRVEGKTLHSQHFLIERHSRKKRENVAYTLDAKTKKIFKVKIRYKKGKIEKRDSKNLKYFADQDPLSLYYNALPPDFGTSKQREYLLAGAEKTDGRIVLRLPNSQEAAKERRELGVPAEERIVYLIAPGKLEGKTNRKIVAAFDTDGRLRKAYLDAIPVVGRIYLERLDTRK